MFQKQNAPRNSSNKRPQQMAAHKEGAKTQGEKKYFMTDIKRKCNFFFVKFFIIYIK